MTGKFNIYEGKRVLLTGHTGFKGSWLTSWLLQLGAEVTGVSLDIPSKPANYSVLNLAPLIQDHRIDIRDISSLKKIIIEAQPDFVFHLAAQALVRPSYEDPLNTLSTNAIGSACVLEAIRMLEKPVAVIMITSDKAYDNVEWVWGYKETDRLGGKDPYSASKGMAELAIKTYVESYFQGKDNKVRLGIARAGNVIGGGDWAIDRVVPDCMRAWANSKTVDIRSPNATRPWQHVLEPLSGYLLLGAELHVSEKYHGEAYNFGPASHQNHSVGKLIDEMAKHWEKVNWNDVSNEIESFHEAGLLKLNCDKALFDLSWNPVLGFEETVRMTVEWYKAYYNKIDSSMHDLTKSQLNEYTNLAYERDSVWMQ